MAGEVVFGQSQLKRARYAVAAVFCVHGAVTGSFATRIPWIQEHAAVGAGSSVSRSPSRRWAHPWRCRWPARSATASAPATRCAA